MIDHTRTIVQNPSDCTKRYTNVSKWWRQLAFPQVLSSSSIEAYPSSHPFLVRAIRISFLASISRSKGSFPMPTTPNLWGEHLHTFFDPLYELTHFRCLSTRRTSDTTRDCVQHYGEEEHQTELPVAIYLKMYESNWETSLPTLGSCNLRNDNLVVPKKFDWSLHGLPDNQGRVCWGPRSSTQLPLE